MRKKGTCIGFLLYYHGRCGVENWKGGGNILVHVLTIALVLPVSADGQRGEGVWRRGDGGDVM